MTSFNKHDWITVHQFNTLINLAGRYPPFASAAQKLTSSRTLFEQFFRDPDSTRIPVSDSTSGTPVSESGEFHLVSVLATMVLRPDRFKYALEKWVVENEINLSETNNKLMEFPDAFATVTAIDAMRPILILKNDNDMVDDDSKTYLSVLKKIAHVSFKIFLTEPEIGGAFSTL